MIHIVIHILPQEIDQLEQLLIQLKRNSVHLPKDHGIKVEVCLNLELTNWGSCFIGKKFFIGKFEELGILTSSWADTMFYTSETIIGCNDARRQVIRTTDLPYIMYLDADNVFSQYMLLNIWQACEALGDNGNTIITPQTTRLWDNSWDVITNRYFLDQEASHEEYDVRDPYEAVMEMNTFDRRLKLISGFKFAGWGTTISTKLAKFIDIPDSLGSYGLDDTFIMHCAQAMKDKGMNVNQYVIENEVIIENNKFRFNPYKDYLVSIDKREEFLAQAHANFLPELEKFKSRI